ncbi:Oxidoreductase htatip2 [Dissophora globulifera]|uniref:Oxidoreductase htatip2 n=1 Tax=Dissophora globulifera TaxID=979702 RepID=A0A9P6RSG7_9FUNG|nr:Oxidoreductase htatip2 [Dissophora globulifera]
MSISKNSALVLGGTGAVGKCLVRDALASDAFTRVLTLGRRPVAINDTFTNISLLDQKSVDFENIPATFPETDIPQIVFCSLATTRAQTGWSAAAFKKIDQQYVLDSARYIHEKAPKDPETGKSKVHFLHCSSLGANADSLFLYPKTKGETENALAEIGFERLSIFHPAFLKVVEPREHGVGAAEWAVGKLVPVLDFLAPKSATVSVATVAKSMRIVGTSDNPQVEGVEPKSAKINPVSKTLVAYYSNANMHEIVQKHDASKQ